MKKIVLSALLLLAVATSVYPADSSTNSISSATAVKSYQIRNCKYGDLLRPQDANNANGTRIVLYPAQPWKCMTWKLHPAGESVFQLQNHFTSKTISAVTNGAQAALVQIPWNREVGQRPAWRFTKLPDGNFQITDVLSGRALTAIRSEDSDATIILSPWKDSTEQKWELIEIDPARLTM